MARDDLARAGAQATHDRVTRFSAPRPWWERIVG
jgi:hypothetical protein